MTIEKVINAKLRAKQVLETKPHFNKKLLTSTTNMNLNGLPTNKGPAIIKSHTNRTIEWSLYQLQLITRVHIANGRG